MRSANTSISTLKATSNSLAPLQKSRFFPKPVKPYRRFKPEKFSSTGVDPHGNFIEFLKKDVVSNIDIHRDTVKRIDNLDARKSCNCIGVMKRIASAQTTLHKEKYQCRLPTDHISFEPPEQVLPFQRVYDLMITTPGYNGNSESHLSSWASKDQTKTVGNKSSVPYNIISHGQNGYSGAEILGVLDKKITNRKKGVGEYSDLTRVTALKPNELYNTMYSANSNMFRRKTGVFTFMKDAEVKNQCISQLFNKHQC